LAISSASENGFSTSITSAGQWFPAEFQMLVQNANPAVP
jgi:hypothetical protein